MELMAVSRIGQLARSLAAAGGRSSAYPRGQAAASLIDPIALTHLAVAIAPQSSSDLRFACLCWSLCCDSCFRSAVTTCLDMRR